MTPIREQGGFRVGDLVARKVALPSMRRSLYKITKIEFCWINFGHWAKLETVAAPPGWLTCPNDAWLADLERPTPLEALAMMAL